METLLPELAPWRAALLALPPLMLGLAALAASLFHRQVDMLWRLARVAIGLALLAALLSLVGLVSGGAGIWHGPVLVVLGEAGAVRPGLRSDLLGGVVMLLVCFIGWVITGYSRTYLQGADGQPRYVRGLMGTLAAVALLVGTNNLAVLAVAWVATSLQLHGLLTFFRQRPAALIAAHKKFIASRVGDLCLLGGVALLGLRLGTLDIDAALAALAQRPGADGHLQAAALLLAASALLKCAQLPVHGWLIQVMEAPTPVSALLHAGVVNLGGFLLLRVGGLVAEVPAAQTLLVVVGSATAVVAALVMMTRISIKVSLAWSTCAQMGFMLMQCGLGLHALALLHLVAHSLYKAHAFLSAGGAVQQARLRQLMPAPPRPGALAWAGAAVAGLGLVVLAAAAWGLGAVPQGPLLAATVILGLALAPLMVRAHSGRAALRGLLVAAGVAGLYLGLHALVEGAWAAAHPVSLHGHTAPAWLQAGLVAWVVGCFALLFILQAVVLAAPHSALARRLYPAMFGGLYLDELFTRLTFRLWPARLPPPPTLPVPRPHADVRPQQST